MVKKVAMSAAKYKVPLIIDNRIDLAMAVGAQGVHWGQDERKAKVF